MLLPSLLWLRIKQTARLLVHNGVGAFIVAPLAVVFVIAALRRAYSFSPVAFYLLVGYAILFIDQSRKDKNFLRRFGTQGYLIVLVEYSLLALFFVAVSGLDMAKERNYLCLLFLAMVLVVANPQFSLANPITRWIKWLTAFIPLQAFEWRFGLRRFFFLFFTVYIAGLFIVPFLPVTPFVLLYFSTFVYEFYKFNDPKEFIQAGNSTDSFTKNKLRGATAIAGLLFLPHLVMFVVFHFQYYQLVALLWSILIFYINLLYAIALKYANEGGKMYKTILFFILSPLIPVSLMLFYREYKKATCRISSLLG